MYFYLLTLSRRKPLNSLKSASFVMALLSFFAAAGPVSQRVLHPPAALIYVKRTLLLWSARAFVVLLCVSRNNEGRRPFPNANAKFGSVLMSARRLFVCLWCQLCALSRCERVVAFVFSDNNAYRLLLVCVFAQERIGLIVVPIIYITLAEANNHTRWWCHFYFRVSLFCFWKRWEVLSA